MIGSWMKLVNAIDQHLSTRSVVLGIPWYPFFRYPYPWICLLIHEFGLYNSCQTRFPVRSQCQIKGCYCQSLPSFWSMTSKLEANTAELCPILSLVPSWTLAGAMASWFHPWRCVAVVCIWKRWLPCFFKTFVWLWTPKDVWILFVGMFIYRTIE